jgi:hypothetical protein
MTEDTRFLIAALGAYFLGAVYLAGCIAAGIAYGRDATVVLAIASAGIGYLSQLASIWAQRAALALWIVSGCAGLIAGIALVF